MAKQYVYKNVNEMPVNIGGYQFTEGRELESDVLINGFKEAVSNGFLELTERKPEGAGQDATQAPQTGNTGKVKVIFHMGFDAEGKGIVVEGTFDPNAPVEFPKIDPREEEIFEGWFKDARFTKPVNVNKAKAPKEGDSHFYGKYETSQKDATSFPVQNPNGDTDFEKDKGWVILPPLPPPSPPVGDESAVTGSENK
jgi:hypothetical protein